MRSHSRSTSVTRSISPFLWMWNPVARRAIWMSPARRTISVAVARNSGSGGVMHHAFHHDDFHAAFLGLLQHDFVHETANQEDAAAARFQQVFGGERVGQTRGIETRPLVTDADGEPAARRHPERRELHVNALLRVARVAVFDGVDDRLADRDAHPMQRVV